MVHDTAAYNGLAKGLHWLVLLLVVGQFSVAWTMPDIHHGTQPVGLIAWHLSIGLCILLVMLVRLGWRMVSQVPPPPADLPASLRLLSRVTHFVLYALLIILPLLGWINASARGWPVMFFGVVPLPQLVSSGSASGMQMGDVHRAVALVLLGVAGLHIAGTLYHLLVLRDGVVRRMLPER